MTDDEKRELIAEVRDEFLPHSNDVWACDLAARLADALEGTLTEPEWEYRYAEKYGEELYTYGDFETVAEARAQAIEDTDIVVKRRTSGPWIEVPDV